jgi:RNA polymerase sigma-70 factor
LAGAERWAVSQQTFAAFLEASAGRAFTEGPPSAREVDAYCRSLHLEDLALACACADGHEPAWDAFVLKFRPILYRTADATGDSARAREIADSLYAELFGLGDAGERRSHLRYYHGRSSLATWLRAVFAQRYVDSLRRTARLDALPDDESPRALAASPVRGDSAAARYLEILRRTIVAAVTTLAPRDRLRLRLYYSQELTLAQIGRVLGEHEATVSRHLARARREIRTHVETTLRDREAMTTDEIRDCFRSAAEDSGGLDLADLLGPVDADQPEPRANRQERKEIVPDRST